MSLHGSLIAALYDWWFEPAERAGLSQLREEQLAPASGRVLEIGAGTGLNLPHYPPSVEELTLTESDPSMLRRLVPKLVQTRPRTRPIRAGAEELPLPDASVDTLVSTFVLCTVPSQAQALAEARRVLRSGGKLVFFEHVRSDDPLLARWQDRLARPWRAISYGCNCNRRTLESITTAGFSLGPVRSGDLPKAPPLWRPFILGTATR